MSEIKHEQPFAEFKTWLDEAWKSEPNGVVPETKKIRPLSAMGKLRRIEATILVERESQKAIVVGAGGERLKRMGTAARKDMEKMFGGKVYLGTWVKVRRSWTDDARVLRQLGYE